MHEAKKNCYHYKRGNCTLLEHEGGKLNCEIHRCSFYETKEEYKHRQDEFDKRPYLLHQERMV